MTDHSRRGHLNRQKGKRKQAAVRRSLEALFGVVAEWSQDKRDEESWQHLPVSCEVKAGKQVGPIHTRYLAARLQHDIAVPDDIRPFLFVACPDGLSDAYVVVRLSELGDLLRAFDE